MALFNCPNCGKQVSSRAPKCPHCGFDIKNYLAKSYEEEQQKQQKLLHTAKIVVPTILGIAILVWLIYLFANTSTDIAGHEYVDLNLPSGLKWATCNVGASSPEGYGDYFAWGETSPKSSYYKDNCPTYGKDNSWFRSNGYIDYSGNLTPAHDAARANWGSTWRMPTKAEIDELIENTTTTWTTYNGVYGFLVTSKRNGKSIFLPAAGYCVGMSLDNEGSLGSYWSSTLNESQADLAYDLFFDYGDFVWSSNPRNFDLSIRPVSE